MSIYNHTNHNSLSCIYIINIFLTDIPHRYKKFYPNNQLVLIFIPYSHHELLRKIIFSMQKFFKVKNIFNL